MSIEESIVSTYLIAVGLVLGALTLIGLIASLIDWIKDNER